MERFGLSWEWATLQAPVGTLAILVRQPAAAAPDDVPPDAPTDDEAAAAAERLKGICNG